MPEIPPWKFDPFGDELPEGIDGCRIDSKTGLLVLTHKTEIYHPVTKVPITISLALDAEWLVRLTWKVMDQKGHELMTDRGVKDYLHMKELELNR